MIKINHLQKSFGSYQKIEVLKDMTLEFPNKGLIVLHGQSGSGKTTFLNIIGGLETYVEGSVVIDEKLVKDEKTWNQLRNQEIGYIFQNYNLIPSLSVFDNVALSLRILGIKDEKEIERRVIYTLKAVKMHHFRARYITQLSGGQQQRVSIARAIVKNPKIILADEPTGNLDSKNTFEIMSIIKKISKDKLVILVSHEKNIVNHFADRIIEIKDGTIIKDELNLNPSSFVVDDHTIYLKDLKKQDLKADHFEVDLYKEHHDQDQHKISLIVRNETLYLELDQSIQNVKVIQNDSMIKLEKNVSSKDQENIFNEDNFNLEQLNSTNDLNKRKRFITIKDTFKKSIQSLFNLDKRSSIMLTIFFLMGMMIAIGLPFINNVLSNRMIFKSDQRNYVQVTGIISSGANYRFMESLRDSEDDLFYINVFKRVPMVFDIKSIDSLQRPYINTELGIVDHLTESDLVIGRLPNNQYEIAVDFSLILSDYSKTNSVLRKAGLWKFDQIIGRKVENIYMPNYPFVITGIVNTGAERIYGYKEALVFLNTHLGNNILSSEMFDGNPDFNLNGSMPSSYNQIRDYYEVLIPESLFYQYPGIENFDFSNNQIFEVDYKIFATGTYTFNDQVFKDVILMPASDVSYRIFQFSVTQISFYVYSNNPARFMLDMDNEFNNAQTTWPYQNALNEGRIFLLGLRTLMAIGILLMVVSIFSIYFMLKSSLSSKIQEIGILRALGVAKFEIVIEYITDTFVKLTASSILGYGLVTIFIDQIDQALVGGSYYFLVTFASVFIGIFLIYIIAFIGLIPLFRLLKKTPAQLINYYDI